MKSKIVQISDVRKLGEPIPEKVKENPNQMLEYLIQQQLEKQEKSHYLLEQLLLAVTSSTTGPTKEVDLTPLQESLQSIKDSVDSISFTAPNVDLKPLQDKLNSLAPVTKEEVKQLLKEQSPKESKALTFMVNRGMDGRVTHVTAEKE